MDNVDSKKPKIKFIITISEIQSTVCICKYIYIYKIYVLYIHIYYIQYTQYACIQNTYANAYISVCVCTYEYVSREDKQSISGS